MKVFIACLGTETNTFSPLPTGERGFKDTLYYRDDATRHTPGLFSEPLHIWRKSAEAHQAEVVESLCTFAEPAGMTTRQVYEGFRDTILDDLRRALPVDIVLLNMHGAMVAEGYLDCEGDLLARVREIVGPEVAVGGELDLHCSVTETMRANADILVTFKEYPHIDAKERAQEVFDLCWDKQQGLTNPIISVHDCRMINMWRTPTEPVAAFVQEMQALEQQDGILSVSFAHGFPWGDVPDASAKMMVVTDGDAARGATVARQLGQRIWDMREETQTDLLSLDEMIAQLKNPASGLEVFADVSDNAGGGAPADSTFVLRALLDNNIQNVASGVYWDPIAVHFCREAGVGGRFSLRVGGKCGVASGDPVDLMVTVKAIRENAVQSFGTATSNMGDAVWVTAEGLDLVLISNRTQTFNPDAFTNLGLSLAGKRAVIVKSTQHFYAGFAPLASSIYYVNAPGAIPPNFSDIRYENFSDAYWPRVANPFK